MYISVQTELNTIFHMRKWLKISVTFIVIIGLVSLVILYSLNMAFIDGDASYGVLITEQTPENEIIFTVNGEVYDWWGDQVKFTDCAYSLMVDNVTLSTGDYAFRGYNNGVFQDFNYSKVRGPGTLNSSIDIDLDNEIFFIITFKDVDLNGYLSCSDQICIKSTSPFTVDHEYRFYLATDINGDDGYPNYIGVVNGPVPAGW